MQIKGLQLKSAIICLLLILIVLSSIVACAKTSSTTTASPSPKTTTEKTSPTATATSPQYGGVLKIIVGASPVNLGSSAETATGLGDTLMVAPAVENLFRIDEQGGIVPWLVTAWQYSPDYKSVTFTLRKGVKFHDGTDFNAEAVKIVIDTLRAFRADLASIASIDAVDDSTVRLNLSRFEPAMLLTLATGSNCGMISPTALKTQSKEWLRLHPVGTGPFKFVSYQTDVSLKYEKFDGYWQKGKPYLDGVQYIIMADSTTALMTFEAGQAQVLSQPQAKDAATLEAAGKYNIGKTPGNVTFLAPNSANTSSPYADIKVRRAVQYAIDENKIVNTLGYGFQATTNQVFGPWNWAFNPAVVGYPYNPTKAKDLLAQAGYANGFKTKIISQTGGSQDVYVAIQSYLSQVGINVELQPVAPVLYAQFRVSGWDGLYSSSFPGHVAADPGSTLAKSFSKKGTSNVSVVYPNDYDAILSQANIEPDIAKRKAFLQEAMRLIIDENCMVFPISGQIMACAKYPQVHDSKMQEGWPQQWNPADAWLSK